MHSRRLRLPLLVIAMSLLTSCAGPGFSDPKTVCPRIVTYGPTFQNRLANEIESLPAGTAIEAAMLDYGRLRAELRACQ